MLSQSSNIPAIKSHLSAEDLRAWQVLAPQQPNSGSLPPPRLIPKLKKISWKWKKRHGVSLRRRRWDLNWSRGTLFGMAPFHPPWGYWSVWMGWFVLRVTKHGTWMFICTMIKLEKTKDTWWWDGPWTSQVSVPFYLRWTRSFGSSAALAMLAIQLLTIHDVFVPATTRQSWDSTIVECAGNLVALA